MELIKNENKINKVLIFDTSELDLAISDSFDLNILANNDYFNALILSKIINKIKIFKFKFFKNKKIKNNFLNIKRKKTNTSFAKKILNFKSSNICFMDTYMLRHQSILLKLFTNKVPSFFFNFNLNVKERTKLDIYKRQKLILTNEKNDKFHIIISEIIKDFLPKSMIENYWKIIDEIVNDKYLSKKIKIIFTTNSFGKSDKHNLWIAEKVSQGSKYIVGQHGFGYLESYDKESRVELRTCDKFISWGNKKYSNKIYPLFNFKTWGAIRNYKKKNKKILIITRSVGTQITHYDRWYMGKKIFQKTKNFIQNINNILQKNIVLKLHDNYKRNIYPDFDLFLKNKKNLFVNQHLNFFDLVKDAKIVIFNDYSTGFLECLSLDIPAVCLLPFDLNFIHIKNQNDFEILAKNRLIFYHENELADFINHNYENINTWWNSKEIRKVKENFCIKYTKKSYKSLFKNLKIFSSKLS